MKKTSASTNDALRSTALQTANSVLSLQRRAQNELVAAKQTLEDRTRLLAASVSDLQARESQLVDNNRFLQSINDTSPDTLYLYDLQRQKSLYVNRHPLLALGYPPSKPGARNAQFLLSKVHPDDVATVDAHRKLQHVSATDELPYVEYRIEDASGGYRWFGVRERVYRRDANGAPLVLFGISQDISELKRTEATRRELESQLRESQKMEAIGTLAGGIAHDFNNILAAIIGNASIGLQSADLAETRVCLHEIAKAGKRAEQLIKQILTFSRRQNANYAVHALKPLVEESLTLLRATLPAGISIDLALKEQALLVRTDATQFEQVVLNLVTNAWHALPESRGQIHIQLDVVDHSLPEQRHLRQRCARLAVSDNGCGMDTGTLARIFEPFYTTKAPNQGTGLGLAVVHGIVHAHGGDIVVHSKPGIGSTFEVFLPLASPSSSVDTRTASTTLTRGGGERILYVDDDGAIVFLVKRLLTAQGYSVTALDNSQTALELLRKNPYAFDLLVTDYNMPGASGLDVAAAARETRRDLPVVVTSGYVDDKLRTHAHALGVRAIVPKPDTVEALCAAIQSILVQRM